MKILVLGGTRFFGKHLVKYLLQAKHQVTIATRGYTKDNFGDNIERIIFDRTDINSIVNKLSKLNFDVVYDNLSYTSRDVKRLLDNLNAKRYIMTSSASIYDAEDEFARESDFIPKNYGLIWYERKDTSYYEAKRQADAALVQEYSDVSSIAVRFPFVIGEDDYTERLKFYMEHIIKEKCFYADNLGAQMSFISSDDAGKFLAWLAAQNYEGSINGASPDTISMSDVITYIENKTCKKALLKAGGDKAPYNGEYTHSINIDLATALGFKFTPINPWIYNLIDKLILKM